MNFYLKETRADGSKVYRMPLEEQRRLREEAKNNGELTKKIVTGYVIYPETYKGVVGEEDWSKGGINVGCDFIKEMPTANLIDEEI